jgi:hypothetical protein
MMCEIPYHIDEAGRKGLIPTPVVVEKKEYGVWSMECEV